MLFDTHAHLYDENSTMIGTKFIRNVLETVEHVVVPGEDAATSAQALELCAKYSALRCAVGVHPHLADQMTEDDFAQIRHWAETEEAVVAIGEIGLDYYYDNSPREIQREVFRRFVRLRIGFADRHPRSRGAWRCAGDLERRTDPKLRNPALLQRQL